MGPADAVIGNQPNRLFRRNSKLFRRLFVQNTDRAPRVRVFQGISAVHQRASGKKLRFPEKRDFPDRMLLPPALPVQKLCTIPDDNRAPDQKLHHGNLPTGPKTVLIGFKQLPDFRNAVADAAEHAGTTHIADPDTPHSFPAFDLKASLYPPKCCNQAKKRFSCQNYPYFSLQNRRSRQQQDCRKAQRISGCYFDNPSSPYCYPRQFRCQK